MGQSKNKQTNKKSNNNLKQKFTETVLCEATIGITPASQCLTECTGQARKSLRNVLHSWTSTCSSSCIVAGALGRRQMLHFISLLFKYIYTLFIYFYIFFIWSWLDMLTLSVTGPFLAHALVGRKWGEHKLSSNVKKRLKTICSLFSSHHELKGHLKIS